MSPLGVLLRKELRVETRSREGIVGALFLTFMVLLLARLAWPDVAPQRLAPGVIWIAVVFAGTLSLGRNLHRERDRGTWQTLSLLPVDAGTVFLAKVASNALFVLLVQALAVVLFEVLFSAPLRLGPALVPSMLLGTLGFSAAGTLVAATSAHGRARELLMPVLLLPFLVPLFLMAVQSSERALAGASAAAVANELALLAAMDAIFLAIGWLAFDHLLGD